MIKKILYTGIVAFTTITHAHSDANPILSTYADIAYISYKTSLDDAIQLQNQIKVFAKTPNAVNFEKSKTAWLASRESYGLTEIFRLSNGPIDAESGWVAEAYGSLEGQLNAWPLDENMIDYTITADGKKTQGNIIDTTANFTPGGENATTVNISNITIDNLTKLNENGGDANVATGYHAVEFLLWGQDQDYGNFIKDSITNGPLTAGQRPLDDFTTDKNATRRLDYLVAASNKIVKDLTLVTSAWNKTVTGNAGLYRAAFLGQSKNKAINIKPAVALQQILSGMGVFIKSELANERIAVAVLTPSEEDEHSCFSDNTHRDITQNYQGFKNVLLGQYNNKKMGTAPIDALSTDDKEKIYTLMSNIESAIQSINHTAETTAHFDYQIQPNNPQSTVIISMKNKMRKLGDKIIIVSAANGVPLNKTDVTDADETSL